MKVSTGKSNSFIGTSLLLILIVALGFILRIWSINHDLPYIYNLDELKIINPIMDNFFRGDLNPHWFEQPGAALMYLIFGVLGIYYNLGVLLGGFSSVDSFISSFQSNPTAVILVGRTITVLFGTLSILLVFFIARRVFNRPTGLIAALFFAVAPMQIIHSRVIRTDVTSTFFLLAAACLLFRFLDKGKLKSLIFSGVMGGIATAIKYPSAVIMIPITLGIFLRGGDKSVPSYRASKGITEPPNLIRPVLPALFIAAAAFILGFAVTAPYAILDYKQTLSEIRNLKYLEPAGYPHIGILEKFIWYLNEVIRYAAGGIVIQLLAVLGLITAILSGKKTIYVLISIPLVVFLILFVINTRQPRYVIPLLPFVAIFAGRGLYFGLKTIIGKKKYFSPVLGLAAILAALNPGLRAAADGRRSLQKDNRTLCKEWVEANIPPGSRIAYEAFCPQFDQQPKNNYHLLDMKWHRIVSLPIKSYLDRKIDYIILHSKSQWWTIRNPRRWPEAAERYRQLEEHTKLIMSFPAGKNPGPALEIYQLLPPGNN